MKKVTTEEKEQILNEVLSETQQELKKAGFGLPKLIVKLGELLEAQKPISCIKGKEANGGTVDFVDVPDNQTQIKALDMAFELGDHYPSKKVTAEVKHEFGELPVEVSLMFEKIYSKAKNDKKRKSPKL